MTRSLTRSEVREIDRIAIEKYHLPGIVLMENAGRGTAELLQSLGITGKVLICAGKGNNGGDGFVIARHLEQAGVNVEVLLFASAGDLQGDAQTNLDIHTRGETPLVTDCFQQLDEQALVEKLSEADWVVDALLGTGLQGPAREPWSRVICQINQADRKILAVDLPSGLDCDIGQPLGDCVQATHTATFVARKRGFEQPDSVRWTGTVHIIGIGVPLKLLVEQKVR